ncbi:MAG: NUDIX hydrolase [Bacteroidales bacterium]|jgi:8-oxo-dGTP diphosphatase|nr:NUDIX hydrolase [Bacteroidales bacterium]
MNQQLYDKNYQIPPNVLKGIQATLVSNPQGDGTKRAKYMLKNGVITYQAMKRLKNFFDHFNPQTNSKAQFALAGGQQMKAFIEKTLNQDRNAVETGKKVRQDIPNNFSNQDMMPNQAAPRMNEEKKKEKDKNAVAVIMNNDNKILLLKRGETAPWMSNKWSLVGGKIEKGETPQQAVEREILEETGLEIKKFTKSFTIERHADSIEHIFACRYNGEPTDIKLDNENTNYGWYDVSEMEYLDIVPHLIEFITLVFKKYD